MVCKVDHDAFGVHAERGGDQLGIGGIDQVGQAGAAQHAGRDAARVEELAGIGGVGGCGWGGIAASPAMSQHGPINTSGSNEPPPRWLRGGAAAVGVGRQQPLGLTVLV